MMEFPRRVKRLLSQTGIRLEHHGFRTAAEFATTHLRYNLIQRQILGEDVFEGVLPYDREWDLLIVLDACRADLFSDVVNANNYNYVDDFDSIVSVGGKSAEWMRVMFNSNNYSAVEDTAYVTGNPHTDIVFSEEWTASKDDFELLDEVWKYGWDDDIGTVLAETITDRAIDVGRSTDASRVIVHYMQPHFPSVPYPSLGSEINLEKIGDEWPDSIWEKAIYGKIPESDIWEAYVANTEYVMDSLETLLTNFEASEAVITADHGNAVGEKGFYGHGGYPVREVRDVPWCYATATDEQTVQSSIEKDEAPMEGDVQSRLKSLGYLN